MLSSRLLRTCTTSIAIHNSIRKSCNPRRTLATPTSFREWRTTAKRDDTMATSSQINLTVHDTGIFKFKAQTAETAAKISELLQENHDVSSCFKQYQFQANMHSRSTISSSMMQDFTIILLIICCLFTVLERQHLSSKNSIVAMPPISGRHLPWKRK